MSYFATRAAGAIEKRAPHVDVAPRVLICTRCNSPVTVYEAAMGARTELEHQYLDPATYVCEECL